MEVPGSSVTPSHTDTDTQRGTWWLHGRSSSARPAREGLDQEHNKLVFTARRTAKSFEILPSALHGQEWTKLWRAHDGLFIHKL